MAKLVFGMNQSLDGYIDPDKFAPDAALFGHWIEFVRGLAASVYGRRLYESMRYWDEDRPEWTPELHEFAAAWRRQPKWVVSRSLKSVGPNATLVADDIEATIRGLKTRIDGEIQVGRTAARAAPDRAWSRRRVSALSPSRRARRRHAVLRRPAAAAASCRQRADRRAGDQIDLRSCLIARTSRERRRLTAVVVIPHRAAHA
jgi:hypothetical protein